MRYTRGETDKQTDTFITIPRSLRWVIKEKRALVSAVGHGVRPAIASVVCRLRCCGIVLQLLQPRPIRGISVAVRTRIALLLSDWFRLIALSSSKTDAEAVFIPCRHPLGRSPKILWGIRDPPNLQSPNGCQIVCSKSFFSVGTMY